MRMNFNAKDKNFEDAILTDEDCIRITALECIIVLETKKECFDCVALEKKVNELIEDSQIPTESVSIALCAIKGDFREIGRDRLKRVRNFKNFFFRNFSKEEISNVKAGVNIILAEFFA